MGSHFFARPIISRGWMDAAPLPTRQDALIGVQAGCKPFALWQATSSPTPGRSQTTHDSCPAAESTTGCVRWGCSVV